MTLDRVSKRSLFVHLIVGPTTCPMTLDVARGLEVDHDPVGRALRDPHEVRDIAQPYFRIACDAEQGVSVIRQERPARFGWCCLCSNSHFCFLKTKVYRSGASATPVANRHSCILQQAGRPQLLHNKS